MQPYADLNRKPLFLLDSLNSLPLGQGKKNHISCVLSFIQLFIFMIYLYLYLYLLFPSPSSSPSLVSSLPLSPPLSSLSYTSATPPVIALKWEYRAKLSGEKQMLFKTPYHKNIKSTIYSLSFNMECNRSRQAVVLILLNYIVTILSSFSSFKKLLIQL